jgi:hypothetical protein
MKIGIMQPYLFPYLGYWQLINVVDHYLILDDVTFIKQGYINRNSVLSGGKAMPFNIVVQGISSNKLINEHELNGDPKWKKKLLKTIAQNYAKAPEFNNAFPLIESCINHAETNLAKYLAFQIRAIAKFMHCNTKISLSSEICPKNELGGQARIIEVCKQMDANTYINAIGGKELYSKASFKEEQIALQFLEMERVEYKQFQEAFMPHLSIIDVLMFNSSTSLSLLLSQFKLN